MAIVIIGPGGELNQETASLNDYLKYRSNEIIWLAGILTETEKTKFEEELGVVINKYHTLLTKTTQLSNHSTGVGSLHSTGNFNGGADRDVVNDR